MDRTPIPQKLVELRVVYVTKKTSVLEDMGIETQKEYFTRSGVIDLNRVEAFWPEDQIVIGQITAISVQFQSGQIMTICIPYERFKLLIHGTGPL